MVMSDESLDEFIEIYAADFGEQLSRAEARPIATNLLNLYRMVMRPLPGPIVGAYGGYGNLLRRYVHKGDDKSNEPIGVPNLRATREVGLCMRSCRQECGHEL